MATSHPTQQQAAGQNGVRLLELGVEWVVLVVYAPVGQHKKTGNHFTI